MTFEELDQYFEKYTDPDFRAWVLENDKLGEIVINTEEAGADITFAQTLLWKMWEDWRQKDLFSRNQITFRAEQRMVTNTIGWTPIGLIDLDIETVKP